MASIRDYGGAARNPSQLADDLGEQFPAGSLIKSDGSNLVTQTVMIIIISARKRFGVNLGTQSGFTSGRVVGAFSTAVLESDDTLNSDHPSTLVGENNESGKSQILLYCFWS